MVDTPAFHTEVIAYPAITVIARGTPGPTRIARRPTIKAQSLESLARNLTAKRSVKATTQDIREVAIVPNGSDPWLLESSGHVALIRRLEQSFPSLEDVGCTVGIGVATGADKAFIGDFKTLAVEEDRKVPLVTTKDIASGEVAWQGLGVINPFAAEGGLVDLTRYPRLGRYLEERREVIEKRHCAQKNPGSWYRTIDRISPELAKRPKLLIPDIKGEAHVVFESGELYPHHNLYYVVSDEWDLRALQAVLLSSLSRLFIATYSTKMHGGFLRFQAQYLRRIRVPRWSTVAANVRTKLISAAETRDLAACNVAVAKLYSLDADEQAILERPGDFS
jgi:hypothetical protein